MTGLHFLRHGVRDLYTDPGARMAELAGKVRQVRRLNLLAQIT